MRPLGALAWSVLVVVASACGSASDPPLAGDQPPQAEAPSELVPNAFEISIGRKRTLGERFELDRSRHVEKMRVEVGADGERRESVETIDASFRGGGEVVSRAAPPSASSARRGPSTP